MSLKPGSFNNLLILSGDFIPRAAKTALRVGGKPLTVMSSKVCLTKFKNSGDLLNDPTSWFDFAFLIFVKMSDDAGSGAILTSSTSVKSPLADMLATFLPEIICSIWF